MKAVIGNYRRSRHSQSKNHMILLPEGVKTKKDADALKGKTAIFTTESKKQIKGKVSGAHGAKGAIRVIFERGLPGQSIGQKADIA